MVTIVEIPTLVKTGAHASIVFVTAPGLSCTEEARLSWRSICSFDSKSDVFAYPWQMGFRRIVTLWIFTLRPRWRVYMSSMCITRPSFHFVRLILSPCRLSL